MSSRANLRDPAAGCTGPRDSLYSCWELPATCVLLNASAKQTSDVPPVADIVRALRNPLDHVEMLATTHARVVGLSPGVAQARWLSELRKAAFNFPSDFDPILETFPEVTPSVDESEEDEDGIIPVEGSTDGVRDKSRFDAFESIEAYASLTAEQRLRLLHAVAEIAVCDPRLCPSANARASQLGVEQLRPEPFGYDQVNVYWYFGDGLHLFREPDQRRVESAKKKNSKNKKDKKKLNEEKRKRIEERKKVAERKRIEKEKRARKREEERERKRAEARAKWAPRHPNARVTRRSKAAAEAQLAAAMAASKKEESGEEGIENEIENNKNMADMNGEMKSKVVKEELVDIDAEQLSESESIRTVDPTVRTCSGWECVCTNLDELKSFAERFGKPEDIKHIAERRMVFRMWDELVPIFDDRQRVLAREARKAMMNELRTVRKRSARVAAMEAIREGEREAKKQAKRLMQLQQDEDSSMYQRLDREARREAREIERERNIAMMLEEKETKRTRR